MPEVYSDNKTTCRRKDDMGDKLLGQILLENGDISPKQLEKALELQKTFVGLLGMILVNQRIISEKQLLNAIKDQS